MILLPKTFIALLTLDAVTVVVAAALLLLSFWKSALAVVAALFVANLFLVPPALRAQKDQSRVSDKGRSGLWLWGFALLAAAAVRSALFMESGFSWLGLVGVIVGLVLGALFLVVAKKSREVSR